MSHTFEAPSTKKEFRLPRKLLIEKARKDDVVLPPRTQLHIDVEDVIEHALGHDYADEHTPETCWRCAAEMDPDYGVDDEGNCYAVGPNPPFIPRKNQRAFFGIAPSCLWMLLNSG